MTATPTNETRQRIYLDHAATGWPKPPAVYEAMDYFARQVGASAGRGAYRSASIADEIVASCRRRLARLVNHPSPQNVAFFSNGTTALNAAVFGVAGEGDHVITTAIEHNSLLRPLNWLAQHRGIKLDIVPCDELGRVDPGAVAGRLRPTTRLVAISHASNVTGAVQDVAAIGGMMRGGETLLLCDAAQTLGYLPIDMQSSGIDMLAAPGHKGACGPLGTGILALSDKAAARMRPTIFGGTGSISQQLDMPTAMPGMLEAGNLNVTAIAGWDAGLAWLAGEDQSAMRDDQRRIASRLRQVTAAIAGTKAITGGELPIVSLLFDDVEVGMVATLLDTEFGIEVRSGLHCAALIHDFIGTSAPGMSSQGTLRISGGHGTTLDEIDRLGEALEEIATELQLG
jgi:selenocysteine lyase/cysteine desulfurase